MVLLRLLLRVSMASRPPLLRLRATRLRTQLPTWILMPGLQAIGPVEAMAVAAVSRRDR